MWNLFGSFTEPFNFFPPSCWFASHSAFNNFMQKSVMSQSQNMANLSMFPLSNRVQYFSVFLYSLENILVSNFIKPADLFLSFSYSHFKTYNLILSIWVNVNISGGNNLLLGNFTFEVTMPLIEDFLADVLCIQKQRSAICAQFTATLPSWFW